MMNPFIPYTAPTVRKNYVKRINDFLDVGWLATGQEIEALEDTISALMNSQATTCSSGTTALECVAEALGIDRRYQVYVPNITFVASAAAFARAGAHVTLVDVDEQSGLLNEEVLRLAVEQNPLPPNKQMAIVVVHLGGRYANVKEIREAFPEALIVEDCAHCFGSKYSTNQFIGDCAYSNACTFSFHATKTIAGGEGGAITTKCSHLMDKIKLLKSHGIRQLATAENWCTFDVAEPATNSRMPEIIACLINAQVDDLHWIKRERQKRRNLLDRIVEKIDYLSAISQNRLDDHNDHLYQIQITDTSVSKTDLVDHLRRYNVGTQTHYQPLSTLSAFKPDKGMQGQSFDNSFSFVKKTISIPFHNNLNAEHLLRIERAFSEFKPA